MIHPEMLVLIRAMLGKGFRFKLEITSDPENVSGSYIESVTAMFLHDDWVDAIGEMREPDHWEQLAGYSGDYGLDVNVIIARAAEMALECRDRGFSTPSWLQ